MVDQTHHLRQSPKLAIGLAAGSSLFFGLLFWIWERDLLWMLPIVLLPIWSSVVYQRFSDEPAPAPPRLAIGLALGGLAALLVAGFALYWVS
ncbi:MAG: hypothetical protein ACR2P0_13475 [Acidimicrobiales bacterium]